MEFRILGPLEIAHGEQVVALPGRRQRALLALLLLSANEIVSSDRLIEELWGEQPPESGRAALKVRVSQLRKALGPAGKLVQTRAPGYLLRIEADQLDLVRFERLVGEAEGAAPALAASVLREALALWRGAPLADLAYEPFAQVAIRRLDDLRVATLQRRIDADLALGRHAEVAGELEELVAEHPLQERFRGQLMLALYRSGRQADALAAYQSARGVLVEELGIEPSKALRELEAAILTQDSALDPTPAVEEEAEEGGVPVADAVGLPVADAVAASVGGGAHLPGPQTPARGQTRHNLPAQISSFVGRERELGQLTSLLRDARLVMLTGAGGVGKTRLALQLAWTMTDRVGDDRFGDGVWLVDLAPLADPALLAAKAASVLGIQEEPGRSASETLVAALREREVLVVLDNCEHLVGEAASVVDQLVKRCPGVVILATSREPLAIGGEHVYRVPSLAVPPPGEEDLDGLLGREAVRMFVDRARQQRPGFELDQGNGALVGRLCRRLDGIPLAIELAAARLSSASLDDLERGLDQRFELLAGGPRVALPRQQTLEALLDWSYNLLGFAEQELFERLSVFAGSFDVESAAAVADRRQPASSVLDQLRTLVDKSLVQADDAGAARYRLLETVRDYAAAKLVERSAMVARSVRVAHRNHYLALAETAAPHLIGPRQVEWLDRLSLELDNFRAALSTCLADADPSAGLRLSTALHNFWRYREPTTEGAAAVCAALDRAEAQRSTLIRGSALVAAASLLTTIEGEHDAAVARAQEALAIAQALPDERLRARAVWALALIALNRGEADRVLELTSEGLGIARTLPDPHLVAELLTIRATSPRLTYADRVNASEECLALLRRAGNRALYAHNLNNLGYLEMEAGQVAAARLRLDEAVRVEREIGDQRGVAYAICNLAFASLLDGADADADAGAMFEESLRTARRMGDVTMLAYAQLGLAVVASRAGESQRAASLHGAADAIHERLATRVQGIESRLREADIARLRAELGDAVFDTAYSAGQSRGRAAPRRSRESAYPCRVRGRVSVLVACAGSLVVGAWAVPAARSNAARSSGARSSGARSSGARSSGARSSGARSSGARSSGARSSGARSSGARSSGARSNAARSSGAGLIPAHSAAAVRPVPVPAAGPRGRHVASEPGRGARDSRQLHLGGRRRRCSRRRDHSLLVRAQSRHDQDERHRQGDQHEPEGGPRRRGPGDAERRGPAPHPLHGHLRPSAEVDDVALPGPGLAEARDPEHGVHRRRLDRPGLRRWRRRRDLRPRRPAAHRELRVHRQPVRARWSRHRRRCRPGAIAVQRPAGVRREQPLHRQRVQQRRRA